MSEQRAEADERREEPGAEASEPGAPEAESEAPEPEEELERTRRERDEYLEMAQRARAELENFRKRARAETAGAEQRGKAAVARDLIPALDNLERALVAAGVKPGGGNPQGEPSEPASQEVSAHTALAEGVALVYRELCAGIERAGVVSFDPLGERFDPALHEAVATADRDGAEPGTILETLEKGYCVGDQVLRPARVVVSG